jgi:hypothetical protein
MKFVIEQLAIVPVNPILAFELLSAMGATDWAFDTVTAEGTVYDQQTKNVGKLAFNYQLGGGPVSELTRGNFPKPIEFEVLEYETGDNWIDAQRRTYGDNMGAMPVVSHLGMHVSDAMLAEWKKFFEERNIPIAQEVNTLNHTNPVIAGKRQYTYCIFETRHILGFDLKFIVRREVGRSE